MAVLVLMLLALTATVLATVGAAFAMLQRLRLRFLADRSGRGERIAHYMNDPPLVFVPVRIGLVTVTCAAMVVIVRSVMWLGAGPALTEAALFLAAFSLVFEMVLPSLIARAHPERVFETLLPVFAAYARVVSPLAAPLIRLAHVRRAAESELRVDPGVSPTGENLTVDDGLRPREEQELFQGERRLLQSIVDFGDTRVREVMTPRPDVVAIRAQATVEQLRELVREQEYSRLPVYNGDLDHIVGMVYVKDLIHHWGDQNGERPIMGLVRPALFVPETKRVVDLLREFQREQTQIAIVVDEYGGTAGLVTIEDLLEELVGEIRDEYDVEAEPVVDEGNGSYLVSGKATVDAMEQLFHVPLEHGGVETVGGLLLARLGRVPARGEVVELDGLRIEVVDAERRRVHRVRVTREVLATPNAREP